MNGKFVAFVIAIWVLFILGVGLSIVKPWKPAESFAERHRSSYLPRTDREFIEEERRKARETLELLESVK